MTSWYVKELSELTDVSVQALHHYDRIDVLKPSIRRPNGYRVYSQDDLLKLQQIIALKFFGFELKQIKTLLSGKVDPMTHFKMQTHFLDDKVKVMAEASKTLKTVLATHAEGQPLSWESILNLIRSYNMTQELEKTWAKEALTPEEFKDYVDFESDLETEFLRNPQKRDAFLAERTQLIQLAMSNLKTDPESDVAFDIAHRWMKMVNRLYGPEKADIKKAVWEKGIKANKIEGKRAMDPEMIMWLDKAIDFYWRRRIYTLLDEVEKGPKIEHRVAWEAILEEMCGDSAVMKREMYDYAETDDRIGSVTKKWLAKLRP